MADYYKLLEGSDLAIVEQASKLLLNHILVMQNVISIRKVASWGHGKFIKNRHPIDFENGSRTKYSRMCTGGLHIMT